MILTPAAIRKVRPIAENLNDLARLETYLSEAENLRLIDAIGASLYRWFDETDFSGDGPFVYTKPNGKQITITKEQYLTAIDGGYYTVCDNKEKKSQGIVPAIAYIAYARFVMNNPVNTTAFGVVQKNGEFSSAVNDTVLVRTSNEARKIGEAYLTNVIEYLGTLGLLDCCKRYSETPRRDIRIGRYKL